MSKVVNYLMSKGYLVDPNLIKDLVEEDGVRIINYLDCLEDKPLIIDNILIDLIKKEESNIKIHSLELPENEINYPIKLTSSEESESNVIIIKNYFIGNKKYSVQDFVQHFRLRYNKLKNLLISRIELQEATSISRLVNKKINDHVAVIGLVLNKKITKNGNIILSLEDPTGNLNIIFSKNKNELFSSINDVLFDEVIGITGKLGDGVVFADGLYLPDLPLDLKLKKSDVEEYVAFTSDMQVGSKVFYETNFLKFIDWLNGDYGSPQQKEIAKKVKYLFIPGDLVDGVGVYPGQEEDLEITDIYKQYQKFAEYILKLRKDLKIILSPGNHDSVRIAEPQPLLDKKAIGILAELPNIFLTTNPAIVNIGSTESFQGFNVLIYHGFSFPYIAENVDSIRKAGRLDNPEMIMKYLLQRRHLAPTHASNQYLPSAEEDPLFIEKIPDFFISGHIHKTKVMNYKNITLMNCSCWIAQTEDQERRGIQPDPCKVILVNLKTREIKILNFMDS